MCIGGHSLSCWVAQQSLGKPRVPHHISYVLLVQPTVRIIGWASESPCKSPSKAITFTRFTPWAFCLEFLPGNEDDTLGSGKVLVYDIDRFPAHVAAWMALPCKAAVEKIFLMYRGARGISWIRGEGVLYIETIESHSCRLLPQLEICKVHVQQRLKRLLEVRLPSLLKMLEASFQWSIYLKAPEKQKQVSRRGALFDGLLFQLFLESEAEKYHQFHDDMLDRYGSQYHALRRFATETKCPGDQSWSIISWGSSKWACLVSKTGIIQLWSNWDVSRYNLTKIVLFHHIFFFVADCPSIVVLKGVLGWQADKHLNTSRQHQLAARPFRTMDLDSCVLGTALVVVP